jgi:hypothetical protein
MVAPVVCDVVRGPSPEFGCPDRLEVGSRGGLQPGDGVDQPGGGFGGGARVLVVGRGAEVFQLGFEVSHVGVMEGVGDTVTNMSRPQFCHVVARRGGQT